MPIHIKQGGNVEKLREAAAANWEAAVNHRFVKELFSGEISDSVLAKYLIQDYSFVEFGLAQFGACVAFVDTMSAKLRFSKQLGFIANTENTYFVDSFETLKVQPSDQKLTTVTRDFLQQMKETIDSNDYCHLVAMVAVAEWVYLDWAESHSKLPSRKIHSEWVELHRGSDFEAWTQFLVDELERVFPTDPAHAAKVTGRFLRAVELEKQFFDAAYE